MAAVAAAVDAGAADISPEQHAPHWLGLAISLRKEVPHRDDKIKVCATDAADAADAAAA